MKIVIDNSALYLPKCGIQRYAECVIEGLLDQLGESNVMLLPINRLIEYADLKERFSATIRMHYTPYDFVISSVYCSIQRRFDPLNARIKDDPNIGPRSPLRLLREGLRVIKNLVKRLFNEQRILRECLSGQDLYHSLHGFVPEVVKAEGLRRVITIYDIIPLIHPELLEKGGKYCDKRDRREILSLRESDVVFTISEYSKADLCRFNTRIDPEKVHVIHLGAPESFRPTDDPRVLERVHQKFGISPHRGYVLSPLSSDPKKNVPFIVKSFLEMFDAEELGEVQLVLTGKKSALRSLPEEQRMGLERYGDRVVLTGYADDDDLAVLLSGALCYCFPSLYEGFGLPVLEAMQCGTPVITSSTTSLPEVAGGAALLIDPENSEQFKASVRDICDDPQLRKDLSEKGLRRAAGFSWARCVSEMIKAYKVYSR